MSDLVPVDALDFLGGSVDPSMLFGAGDNTPASVVDGDLGIVGANFDDNGPGTNTVEEVGRVGSTNPKIIDLTGEDDDDTGAKDGLDKLIDTLLGNKVKTEETVVLFDLTTDDVANLLPGNDVGHNQDTDVVVEQLEDPLEHSSEAQEIAEYLANYGQEPGLDETAVCTGTDSFQTFLLSPQLPVLTPEQIRGLVHYGVDGAYSSPDHVEGNADASYEMPSPPLGHSEPPSLPVKKSDSPRETLKDIIQRVGGDDTFRERYKAWRCCEKRPLSANELATLDVLAQHDLGEFIRSLGACIELDQLQLGAASSTSGYPVVRANHRALKHQSGSPEAANPISSGITLKDSGAYQPIAYPPKNKVHYKDTVFPKEHRPSGNLSHLPGNNSVEAIPNSNGILDKDPQYQHYLRQWMSHPSAQAPIRLDGQTQIGYAPQQGVSTHASHLSSGTLQPVFLNDGLQEQKSKAPKVPTPPKVSRKKPALQAPRDMHPTAIEMYNHFGQSVPNLGPASGEQGIVDRPDTKAKTTPKQRRRSKADIQAAKLASLPSSRVMSGGNAGLVQRQSITPPPPNHIVFQVQALTRVIQDQKHLIEQQKSLIQAQGLAISHFTAIQGHIRQGPAGRSPDLSDTGSSAGQYSADNLQIRKRSADVLHSGMMDKRHRTGSAVYDREIPSALAIAPAGIAAGGSIPFLHQDAFPGVGDRRFVGNFVPMGIMRSKTPCPVRRSHDRKARSNPMPGSMMNAVSNGGTNSSSSSGSSYVPS